MSGLATRAGHFAAAAASNAVGLATGLASLTAVLRLLDRPQFAAWMVALSAQVLASVLPNALGPGCARWLGADPWAAGACRLLRHRASWVASALLGVTGLLWWAVDPTSVSPLAWSLLALQLPLVATETHHLQTLQMQRRFLRHAALLPLARTAKALALWAAVAAGGGGLELVAFLQLAAQAGVVVLLGSSPPAAGSPLPAGFLRLWSGNLVSGAVVWSGTRAGVVVLDHRSDPEATAAYGLADSLATSLQLPLQALATLIQPSVYAWTPARGVGLLFRHAGLFAAAGTGLGLAAVYGGPFFLDLLAGPSGSGSAPALRILALGVAAQACAVVPGTLLQRFGAGGTIAALEAVAAAFALVGLLGWSHLGAAEAAICWSTGRLAWAVGSSVFAFRLLRRQGS